MTTYDKWLYHFDTCKYYLKQLCTVIKTKKYNN